MIQAEINKIKQRHRDLGVFENGDIIKIIFIFTPPTHQCVAHAIVLCKLCNININSVYM